MAVTESHVTWTSPAPLWPDTGDVSDAAVRRSFREPAIARFARDTFMDDFLAMLQNDPARLREFRAQPETWRGPATQPEIVAPPAFARPLHRRRLAALRTKLGSTPARPQDTTIVVAPAAPPTLKLYQPAHQRFYLFLACLVCRLPGLPDRVVDPGQQERVSFVLRRLRPRDPSVDPRRSCDPATSDEYAFLPGSPAGRWQKVVDPATLHPGEEQLALSAVHFSEDDGRRRRLFSGLIPVARRDAYFGAPDVAPSGTVAPSRAPGASHTALDPRAVLFRALVSEPWRALFDRAETTRKIQREGGSPAPSQAELRALVSAAREVIQTLSWLILLDFAKYLAKYLPDAWDALTSGAAAASTSSADVLVRRLRQTVVDDARAASIVTGSRHAASDVKRSLAAALTDVIAEETKLEIARTDYRRSGAADPAWPSFSFPLADGFEPLTAPVAWAPLPAATSPSAALGDLTALVDAALHDAAPVAAPPRPLAADPLPDGRDPGWFVARAVYERPSCGPLAPPVVSEPTAVFQMAAFFDSDAPARPIRIGLPVDTTPAGFRKFDKNTGFMISDVLCGQMKGLEGLTLGDLVRSVLPWPLHKDLNVGTAPCGDGGEPAGMMCTLSIPIITICALILLIIIVNLLDMIFKWLPYFQFCFPLPGFRAKD